MLVDVHGIRLAYSDAGEGSPVVLLVHGFPLNRSMWDPQRGALRSVGARVVAPDLRGFGASEAGPAGPLTMEQHADDMVGLLDALSDACPKACVIFQQPEGRILHQFCWVHAFLRGDSGEPCFLLGRESDFHDSSD